MKIGDLVKYSDALAGLGKCMGVIIGFNGASCVDVQWIDRYSFNQGVAQSDGPEKTTELAEFLEVVSENR